MHLSHDHKPMQVMTYWILGKDEMRLAQKQPKIMDHPILRLPSVARAPMNENPETEWVTYDARKDVVDSVAE